MAYFSESKKRGQEKLEANYKALAMLLVTGQQGKKKKLKGLYSQPFFTEVLFLSR
jgi:hypothetical protein